VAGAGVAADPALRHLAAGIPRRRWSGPPDAPAGVLGVATGLVAAGNRFVPPPGLEPPRTRWPAFRREAARAR